MDMIYVAIKQPCEIIQERYGHFFNKTISLLVGRTYLFLKLSKQSPCIDL